MANIEYRYGSGKDPYKSQVASATALKGEVSEQQQVLQAAMQSGDPEAIARAQESLQSKMGQYAQALDEAAHPVMPISERVGRSTVSAKLAISQLTFASEQNVRGALSEQMGYSKAEIERLLSRRDDLASKGMLTPGISADIQEQINAAAVQAAQTQHQLEAGWLDRLVSQAFNTPSNGILSMSAFTRREAAMFGGIYHMSFGGTKDQMDYARNGYDRVLQDMGGTEAILGGGKPSSAYDAMFGRAGVLLPRGADGSLASDGKVLANPSRGAVSLNANLSVTVNVNMPGQGTVAKQNEKFRLGDQQSSKVVTVQPSVPGTQ